MFSDDIQHLIWFLLPSESQALQTGSKSNTPPTDRKCIISPRSHVQTLSSDEINSLVTVQFNRLQHKLGQITANAAIAPVSSDVITETDSPTPVNYPDEKKEEPPCVDGSCFLKVKSRSRQYQNSGEKSTTCAKPTQSEGGDEVKLNKVKKARFVPPPKRLFKSTAQAIETYDMIKNGDKVLVCLSGGKVRFSQVFIN